MRRDTCSQLLTLDDADYQAGLRRLAQELQDASGPQRRATRITLLTLTAYKPLR